MVLRRRHIINPRPGFGLQIVKTLLLTSGSDDNGRWPSHIGIIFSSKVVSGEVILTAILKICVQLLKYQIDLKNVHLDTRIMVLLCLVPELCTCKYYMAAI